MEHRIRLPRPTERGTVAILAGRDDPAGACVEAYARAGGDRDATAALVRLAASVRANGAAPCERKAELALIRCAALAVDALGHPRRARRIERAQRSPRRAWLILAAAIRRIDRDLHNASPLTGPQRLFVDGLREAQDLLGQGPGQRRVAPWFGRLGYLAGLLGAFGLDGEGRALVATARALGGP